MGLQNNSYFYLISLLAQGLVIDILGFLLDGLTSNGCEPDVDPVEWIEEGENLSPELGGFDHSEGNVVLSTVSSFVAGHLDNFHGGLFEYNSDVNWND